jgi:hypothetical protein
VTVLSVARAAAVPSAAPVYFLPAAAPAAVAAATALAAAPTAAVWPPTAASAQEPRRRRQRRQLATPQKQSGGGADGMAAVDRATAIVVAPPLSQALAPWRQASSGQHPQASSEYLTAAVPRTHALPARSASAAPAPLQQQHHRQAPPTCVPPSSASLQPVTAATATAHCSSSWVALQPGASIAALRRPQPAEAASDTAPAAFVFRPYSSPAAPTAPPPAPAGKPPRHATRFDGVYEAVAEQQKPQSRRRPLVPVAGGVVTSSVPAEPTRQRRPSVSVPSQRPQSQRPPVTADVSFAGFNCSVGGGGAGGCEWADLALADSSSSSLRRP